MAPLAPPLTKPLVLSKAKHCQAVLSKAKHWHAVMSEVPFKKIIKKIIKKKIKIKKPEYKSCIFDTPKVGSKVLYQ